MQLQFNLNVYFEFYSENLVLLTLPTILTDNRTILP